MTTKQMQRVGDIEGESGILAFNRTGATLKKGHIVMLDVLKTATETTSVVVGDEAGIYANVVAPATAGLAFFPMYVVGDDEIEDNKKGYLIASGPVEFMGRDDDAATTDIDAGDGVSVLNGQIALDASTTGNRVLGIALADAAASGSTGDASLIPGMWWGGAWGAGFVSA